MTRKRTLPPVKSPRTASRVSLEDLLSFFPASRKIVSGLEVVPDDAVPEPYRTLLAHHSHMTVALEELHESPMHLKVLASRHEGDDYARKLVLTAGEDGPVVLLGIMRFVLKFCNAPVRQEIIAERKPLGRILIEHSVLRRVQFHDCLKVDLRRGLAEVFQTAAPCDHTYGRLAMIFCEEQPAVELLEIVAPVERGA